MQKNMGFNPTSIGVGFNPTPKKRADNQIADNINADCRHDDDGWDLTQHLTDKKEAQTIRVGLNPTPKTVVCIPYTSHQYYSRQQPWQQPRLTVNNPSPVGNEMKRSWHHSVVIGC